MYLRSTTILVCSIVLVSCQFMQPTKMNLRSRPSTISVSGSADALAVTKPDTVRFKRTKLVEADMAQALDLKPEELCNELGEKSCFGEVHKIALGGIDPYGQGIYQQQDLGVTTAMVLERVALSACRNRVERDFTNLNQAVIFKDLKIAADGGIDQIDDASVNQAIWNLYTRILSREPLEHETLAIKTLYKGIEGRGRADSAKNWAHLSCFAIMTTLEFVFY